MPGSGNQPARLAQLDDGDDCAILVQGDEGPAQVIQLGHQGTPSVICQRRWCHLLAARPIASLGPTSRKEVALVARKEMPKGSNLYGAFPVKWCFWFAESSLFGAGRPFLYGAFPVKWCFWFAESSLFGAGRRFF